MRARGLIGLGVTVLVAVTVIALLTGSREPTYQGRTLSYWALAISSSSINGKTNLAAVRAISAIGTNAIPYLVKWIQYETPAWKNSMLTLSYRVQRRFHISLPAFLDTDKADNRAFEVPNVMGVLGPAANAAVPELVRLLAVTNSVVLRAHVLNALNQIRPLGFLAMVCALTNRPAVDLQEIRWSLEEWDTEPEVVIILSDWLKDQDERVAMIATRGLGGLWIERHRVRGALLSSLQDPRPAVRDAAFDALRPYYYDDSRILPALLALRNDPDPRIRKKVDDMPGPMQTELEDFILRDLQSLTNNDPDVRLQAANSLERLHKIQQALTNAARGDARPTGLGENSPP